MCLGDDSDYIEIMLGFHECVQNIRFHMGAAVSTLGGIALTIKKALVLGTENPPIQPATAMLEHINYNSNT